MQKFTISDPYGCPEGKAVPEKNGDAASDVSTCTAGYSNEERAAMEGKYKKLEMVAAKLAESLKARDSQIQLLQTELSSKEAAIAALQREAAALPEAEVPEPLPEEARPAVAFEDLDHKGQEAARGRLRRFCQKRADGSLAVPLSVHNQWKEGGAGRERLLHLFVSVGFDRDCSC